MTGQLETSAWLAWRDWKHEFFLSLCAVLALVSMLAPILVLLGIKNGIIDGMRQRLLQDPAILVITPKSDAGKFGREFIASLAELPGAAFAIGRTRETSSDLTLVNPQTEARVSISLEPAAPGEPVLSSFKISAPDTGVEPQIVLSSVSAKALGVSVGDRVDAALTRRTPAGRLEQEILHFVVSGILPQEAADRRMGFVSLGLLEDIENFRDYLEVPQRGWKGENQKEKRQYSSFRLYAKNLYAVESLVENLAAKKIETSSRMREIAVIRQLEASITQIIFIVGGAIGIGFVAFTVSSVQGAVLRKRRQLALLRLFGLKRLPLLFFPLVQIFLTLFSGFLLALAAYAGISFMIGQAFRDQGGMQCVLTLTNITAIAGAMMALSICACAWGAWKSASIEPSTVIRGD